MRAVVISSISKDTDRTAGQTTAAPARRGLAILYRPAARLLLGGAGMLLAGLAVAGCGDEKGAAAKGGGAKDGGGGGEAVQVSLVEAARQPVQRTVDVVGTLWGDEDVSISNKIPGKVIAVYKDEGDRVEPGDVLAQLLRNDYELARNSKESALQETLAQLGVKEVPQGEFDPSDLPAVRRARLQAENARGRYERGKQLHDQTPPLLSQQDFADLKTAFDVAQSAYDVELLTARALLAEARTKQADLRIAEQALKDTTIRAPRPMDDTAAGDGGTGGAAAGEGGPSTGAGNAATAGNATTVAAGSTAPATRPTAPATTAPAGQPEVGSGTFAVAERRIEVGELLSGLTPMFRLVDDDPLKLRALVPERFVPDVKVGQRVAISIEAYGDRVFDGRVARVRPQIDPANRTFQVEVIVPNAARELRAGAFARAKVETRTEDSVFVPAAAVASFAGVSKVFTVKDGKAVEVRVQLGRTRGGDVEVTQGLKGGEPVVATGAGKLATGTPVTLNVTEAAGRDGSPPARFAIRSPRRVP